MSSNVCDAGYGFWLMQLATKKFPWFCAKTGTTYLSHHLPHSKLLDILITSPSMTSSDLISLNLAHKFPLTPDTSTSFMKSVEMFLQRYTHDAQGQRRPVQVVREMRRAVCAVTGVGSVEEWRTLAREREVFERCWGGEANWRAVEGFSRRIKSSDSR